MAERFFIKQHICRVVTLEASGQPQMGRVDFPDSFFSTGMNITNNGKSRIIVIRAGFTLLTNGEENLKITVETSYECSLKAPGRGHRMEITRGLILRTIDHLQGAFSAWCYQVGWITSFVFVTLLPPAMGAYYAVLPADPLKMISRRLFVRKLLEKFNNIREFCHCT